MSSYSSCHFHTHDAFLSRPGILRFLRLTQRCRTLGVGNWLLASGHPDAGGHGNEIRLHALLSFQFGANWYQQQCANWCWICLIYINIPHIKYNVQCTTWTPSCGRILSINGFTTILEWYFEDISPAHSQPLAQSRVGDCPIFTGSIWYTTHIPRWWHLWPHWSQLRTLSHRTIWEKPSES